LSGLDWRYRGPQHRRRRRRHAETEARILAFRPGADQPTIDPLEQLSAGQGGGCQPVALAGNLGSKLTGLVVIWQVMPFYIASFTIFVSVIPRCRLRTDACPVHLTNIAP
jgi:hypothetical protein